MSKFVGQVGSRTVIALVLGIGLFTGASYADSKKAPVNAMTGSAWQADVKISGNAIQLTAAQKKEIGRINAYLNSFKNLKGRFRQTNPDKAQQTGKFFVQRPGKIRFDYAAPSQLMIISDGQYLSIEDHDLKTVDRYPLESTPFKMLLQDHVDILRDGQILGYQTSDKKVAVVLADKNGNSAGQLKLVFAKNPKLDLLEWTITDAQGLDTRIEIGNLEFPGSLEAKLFVHSKTIGLSKVFEN